MGFLIRTKENRISGPFPKETIVARIKGGELREMDEVCPSAGYWIYLHEREECQKILGVALARSDDFHEEATETDTETVTQPLAIAASASKGLTKDTLRDAHVAASFNMNVLTPDEHAPTRNRPEATRKLRLLLWLFLVCLVLILLQVYQLANPV